MADEKEDPNNWHPGRAKGLASVRQPDTWKFGSRQVVYAASGAALYGVLSHVTNVFPLLAMDRIIFRPGVAVLIFFGVACGPWVGFLTGLLGNAFGDTLSFGRFYWNWSLAHGLIGMIPGLIMAAINDFRALTDMVKAVGGGLLGIIVGMSFASVTEMLISGIDLNTALTAYFGPAFIGHALVTVILLPILMILFAGVSGRRGR